MTAEPDLLPLPGSVADWLRRFGAANGSIQSEVIEGWFRHYARANVAHATAAKDAEIEALRAERDLFRDETITLVRQNGEWQARAERLAEALREAKEKMLAQVKWVACDCGCGGDKPADAVSVAWLRASTLLHEQEAGRG